MGFWNKWFGRGADEKAKAKSYKENDNRGTKQDMDDMVSDQSADIDSIFDPMVLINRVNSWDEDDERRKIFDRLFHPEVINKTSAPDLLKEIRNIDNLKNQDQVVKLSALAALSIKLHPELKKIIRTMQHDPYISEKMRPYVSWISDVK